MPEITVYGFPRSTFVQIARLVLTHKDVPYTFRDLEPDMGSPIHLALHPFDRVPILQHGNFTLGLQVMERQLSHGQGFLLSDEASLADYYLLPSPYAFGIAPEAKAMYADFPTVREWRERMEALPTVQRFHADQPPRAPIEHARKWAVSHRPKY